VAEILRLYLRHSETNAVHGPEAMEDRQRTFALFEAHPSTEGGPPMGTLAVTDCKPFHLRDFIEGHSAWKSAATRRSKANMIRAVFQWAADEERIHKNPFLSVRYAEAPPRPHLPDDAFGDLVASANKAFERAVRFLRLTGARLSEMCELQWPHVNLDGGLCVIERHKSRRYTGKAKLIALPEEAVELLRCIRRRQPPDYQGHVFLNTRNVPWNRGTMGQQLRRMKEQGLVSTNASLHGLRHAFAVRAAANGVPMKLLATQLGHASSAVTEKYYADITNEIEAVRKAAQLAAPRKESSHGG
jgi:integrase